MAMHEHIDKLILLKNMVNLLDDLNICSILYFAWFRFVVGLRPIHIYFYLFQLTNYFLSNRTRRLAFSLMIYFIWFIIYDSMRALPNYFISNIHIKDVYMLEKKLFGIYNGNQTITLNEYFREHHTPILDVFGAVCYLNWLSIPAVCSFYLYWTSGPRVYIDFSLTFLLTNILGYILYYIVPTAPPWYVEMYGFDVYTNVRANPAGLIYFDRITGTQICSGLYANNYNVFAAIPSLHAAYPSVTILYRSYMKNVWLRFIFVIVTCVIWFSAVYFRHHYVIDVVIGVLCALCAYLVYRFVSKIPTVDKLLIAYSKII